MAHVKVDNKQNCLWTENMEQREHTINVYDCDCVVTYTSFWSLFKWQCKSHIYRWKLSSRLTSRHICSFWKKCWCWFYFFLKCFYVLFLALVSVFVFGSLGDFVFRYFSNTFHAVIWLGNMSVPKWYQYWLTVKA